MTSCLARFRRVASLQWPPKRPASIHGAVHPELGPLASGENHERGIPRGKASGISYQAMELMVHRERGPARSDIGVTEVCSLTWEDSTPCPVTLVRWGFSKGPVVSERHRNSVD
jgi:hypothetical protein